MGKEKKELKQQVYRLSADKIQKEKCVKALNPRRILEREQSKVGEVEWKYQGYETGDYCVPN